VSQVIEQGRHLVNKGFADLESYQALVKLLVEEKKFTLAEDITAKAVRDYPELRKELYELLESKDSPSFSTGKN
ncbi:MAG: hypothetical protein ACXWRA_10675, partial [Pseudobdellovibrionaceae bacterium]